MEVPEERHFPLALVMVVMEETAEMAELLTFKGLVTMVKTATMEQMDQILP